MDYNKISSLILTDHAVYHLEYNDGTSENLQMYVLRDEFANYPCITITDDEGNIITNPKAHYPLPLYKANKLVSIIRKRTKNINE